MEISTRENVVAEDVLRRTIRSALLLAAVGITAGLTASLGLTHFMQSMLYGVKPLDAAAITGAVAVPSRVRAC